MNIENNSNYYGEYRVTKPEFYRVIAVFVFLIMCLFVGCSSQQQTNELHLGDIAPDFAVKDLTGNVHILSSKKGYPVILRFFETDCRFCKADTPAFTRFYNDNKGKGLEILYIGSFYEDEKALKDFVKELNPDFPVAVDINGRLADLYGIEAYPQTLFISPDQKILAALLGGIGEAELKEIIGQFL